MDDEVLNLRIATYLMARKRAIISIEGYVPRTDYWVVLQTGFLTKEDAREWIDIRVNTSLRKEISEITFDMVPKEDQHGNSGRKTRPDGRRRS